MFYFKQVQGVFELLLRDNVDVVIVKFFYEDLNCYCFVIVLGMYLLDKVLMEVLCKFVVDGGMVIMIVQLVKVNDNNQWYVMLFFGGLIDVFGLCINEFYDVVGIFKIGDEEVKGIIEYYEVLEFFIVEVLSCFSNFDGNLLVIIVNCFGKGCVYYFVMLVQFQIMKLLLCQFYVSFGIEFGFKIFDGVFVCVVDGCVFYVNINNVLVDIVIDSVMKGVFGGQCWDKILKLEFCGVELLEFQN